MLTDRHYMRRVGIAVLITLLAVALLAVLAYVVKGFLVIFAGILFGVFLCRTSESVARLTKNSYHVGVLITSLTLFLVAFALTLFMGTRIIEQVWEFSAEFQEASQELQARYGQSPGWREWLSRMWEAGQQSQIPTGVLNSAQAMAYTGVSVLGGMVLVLFLGLYFAVRPSRYREGFLQLIPPERRGRIDTVLLKCVQTLWYWMLGRLVGMTLIGIGSTLGLWWLGIPLPLTQGILAGLMNSIPNVGPLIASVPPLLFGLEQGGNTALYVLLFYLALQLVESYLITPLIDQQQVNLPPGLTLSAQLILGMLAGIVGVLLATPLTAVASVLIKELYVKDLLERSS